MTDHILFNLGVTRSFVSLAHSKKFSDTLRALHYLLVVDFEDDLTISSPSVYRGCVIELFCVKYFIDLVPIPL